MLAAGEFPIFVCFFKGAPHPPMNLTVLPNVTSSAVTISWLPGFDGGSPPQIFHIECKRKNEKIYERYVDILHTHPGRQTLTLKSFYPDTWYDVRIRSTNQHPKTNSSGWIHAKAKTAGILSI